MLPASVMLYLPWRSSDNHHDNHDDETSHSTATTRSFADVIVTDCLVTGGNRDEALVEGGVGVLSTLAMWGAGGMWGGGTRTPRPN